jgi:serine/threonine protein kinase
MKTIVAKDLFIEAMQMAPEARAAWLAGLSEDTRSSLQRLLEVDAMLDPKQEAGSAEERYQRASSLVAESSIANPAPGTNAVSPKQAVAATGLPTHIGKYRIISKLGEGAQGIVYRAVHPTLNRDVAIKFSRVPSDQSQTAGLQAEAQVLCQLSHPNLAHVYDLDFEQGCPFLVMEYIPGQSLEQLATAGRLTAAQSVEIVRKLCMALEHVHSRGVVHQDLKPENVVVDDRLEPKVIDFGLAHLRTAWAESDSMLAGGTLAYMSPEQAAGFHLPEDPHGSKAPQIDHRADIFALGAILYRLLTGRRLYEATSRDEGIRTARACQWSEGLLTEAGHPQKVNAVCRRAISKNPAARFATCGELATDLRETQPRKISSRNAAVATAVVMGVLWVLLNYFGPSPSNATTASLLVTPDVRITHYGVEGEIAKFAESLGAGDRQPRESDDIRFKANLPKPQYCMLVALNTDGKLQLCYPSNPAQPADSPIAELNFPEKPGNVFSLTDGAGQQAFLLLRSDERLPSYDQWSAHMDSIQWPGENESGMWKFERGAISGEVGQVRGEIGKQKGCKQFRAICEQIESQSPNVQVYGVSFPVAPN